MLRFGNFLFVAESWRRVSAKFELEFGKSYSSPLRLCVSVEFGEGGIVSVMTC